MTRFGKWSAIGGALLFSYLTASYASAQAAEGKIELALRPPPAPTGLVCGMPAVPADIAAKWEGWDGVKPPAGSLDQMLTDGERLTTFDAVKYFDISRKIFTYLRKQHDQKLTQRAGVDYARLFVSANAVTPENINEILDLLRRGQAARNPTSMLILGVIYERGLGVPRNEAQALKYYRGAAQSGRADALIKIAQFKLNGQDVGLNVDPSLIGVLAFSAILGNDAADPCSGIRRIARLYAKGTGVIQKNIPVAVQWFQLAADAGDPDSAWQLARYHLAGDEVIKDNDVLRKYLTRAAEAGVVPAMSELARAYEDGSFVPKNTDLAISWYEKARHAGSASAPLRLAALLNRNVPLKEADEALLQGLAKQSDAPSWIAADYVQILLDQHGRTAAREAAPLLDRGVAAGDDDALALRVELELSDPKESGIDDNLLRQLLAASERGDVGASQTLEDQYRCRDGGAPLPAVSEVYRERSAAGDTNLGVLVAGQLAADTSKLDEAGWQERLAVLRSAAVRQIPDGLALLVDSYETAPATLRNASALAYWKARLMASPMALWRYARLLERRPDNSVALRKELLGKAAAMGSTPAASDLARMLTSEASWKPDNWRDIQTLLDHAVHSGNGMALEISRKLMPPEDFNSLVQSGNLHSVAANWGDSHFAAVLASVAPGGAEKADMLQLATALASCSAVDYFRIVDLTPPGLALSKELNVLQSLAGNTPSEQYRLGRLLELKDDGNLADAMKHYKIAAELGNRAAERRILRAYLTPDSPIFSVQEITRHVPQILASNDAKLIYKAARTLQLSAAPGAAVAEGGDSKKSLYTRAATLGHPGAMRELGLSLQKGDFTARNPEEGADWLTKASSAGDRVASRYVGYAYLVGFGVPRSLDRSMEFFRKAADLGDAEGKRMVERLGELSGSPVQP